MYHPNKKHRVILEEIAHQAMLDYGLLPDYPETVMQEVAKLYLSIDMTGNNIQDLRHLPWCSIDNDSSRDLDQISFAKELPDGKTRVLVAISEVDALVKQNSAIDDYAKHNTTSVYTPAVLYSMLPERLSTDLTSLVYDQARQAVIYTLDISPEGILESWEVSLGLVCNKAKLSYNEVGDWLEDKTLLPKSIEAVKGLAHSISLQDIVAQKLRVNRQKHGALSLETAATRPVFEGDELLSMERKEKNRARILIEDLMICTNGVCALFLDAAARPSFRRVVHTPKRWNRIVEIASEQGITLPDTPVSTALEQFLSTMKERDSEGFLDLSLSIIKLLGPGEYMVDLPGEDIEGHFGLAVRDYTHSTAPNRRYPDLITQRLVQSALLKLPAPYSVEELRELAIHCNKAESSAKKVERRVDKSATAMLLEKKIGNEYDGIITGAASKGTWVRIFHPSCEGRLVDFKSPVDVGQRVKVKLMATDINQGFIDFAMIE